MMQRIVSFLSDAEDEQEFLAEGRLIKRDMVETPLDGAATMLAGRAPLVRSLLAQLRELRRTASSPFMQLACVEVRSGDGKSWSAEALARALEKNHGPAANVHRLNEQAGARFPAIGMLLGRAAVLAAAERHGLVARRFSLRSPRGWALLATLVVATASAAIVTKRIDDREPGEDSAGLVLMSIALAVATVGTGLAGQKLALGSDGEAADALAARLRDEGPTQRFYDDLAAQLAGGPFPRWVVVDDFENLDLTTRLALRAYFQVHCKQRRGAEFWVVFEGTSGDRLSSDGVRPQSRPPGFRLFRQALLNDMEREQLARRVGDESLAEFSVVRDICREPIRGDGRVARLLAEVRERHPAQAGPGALELLYLMALGEGASHGELRRGDLVRTLMRARHPEVMAPFVGTRTLSQHRLRSLLDELPVEFKSLLQVSGRGDATLYSVGVDTLEVLVEHADRLQLPKPGVGRLFWALAGHSQLSRVRNDAALVRAHATLCRGADSQDIDPDWTNTDLHVALLDAFEATVRACIPVCLFHHARRVYGRLRDHATDSGLLERPGVRARVVRLGWELYSLLGDDDLLAALLELTAHAPRRQGAEPAAEPLLALAVEAISVDADARRQLFEAAAARGDDGRLGTPAVADFLRARACWTGCMVVRSSVLAAPSAHARALRGDAPVLELFGRAAHRLRRELDRDGGEPQALDAATASLALWASAQRLWDFEGEDVSSDGLDAELDAVLEAAGQAAELAARLWQPAWESASAGPDFVANGFAGELCAVALAAALSAYHALYQRAAWWVPPAGALNAVRTLFAQAEAVVGYELPPFTDAGALAGAEPAMAVHTALRLSGIVWRHFGMADWGDLLAMRRLEFAAQAIRDGDEREERLKELFSAVAPSLQRDGFHGLAANLVATVATRGTREVQAAYARDAAAGALDSRLGDAVTADVCQLAFEISHGYDMPDRIMEPLLRGAQGDRILDAWLDTADGDQLETLYLQALNVYGKLSSKPLMAAINGSLAAHLERVSDPELRQHLAEMREHKELDQRIARGEPLNLLAIVGEWRGRGRDSWMYISLVERAFRESREEWLASEAIRLTHGADPLGDRIAARFRLAITLGERCRSSTPPAGVELPKLVSFLRVAAREWEPNASVSLNQRAYRLLHVFDREHSYEEKIELWERKKLQRDHLTYFRKWAKEGQHFLIFLEYARSMEFWGLPLYPDGLTRLHTPAEAVEQAVAALLAARVMPTPFVHPDEAPAVSSDFLALGSYLTEALPHAENPALAPLRAEFNTAAERELPALIEMVLELPGLPRRMRDLLRSYTEREEIHVARAEELAEAA